MSIAGVGGVSELPIVRNKAAEHELLRAAVIASRGTQAACCLCPGHHRDFGIVGSVRRLLSASVPAPADNKVTQAGAYLSQPTGSARCPSWAALGAWAAPRRRAGPLGLRPRRPARRLGAAQAPRAAPSWHLHSQ